MMGASLIDRPARNSLVEALRALSSGAISNDEFERRLPLGRTGDPAIREIYSKGAWMLYSDLHEYRLTGKDKLDVAAKAEVARWVLFLKTELPYEWPVLNAGQSLVMLLFCLLTFGWANRLFASRFRAHGDSAVWPFIRRTDYEAALHVPPYLDNAS
jgi:hypothetical protein